MTKLSEIIKKYDIIIIWLFALVMLGVLILVFALYDNQEKEIPQQSGVLTEEYVETDVTKVQNTSQEETLQEIILDENVYNAYNLKDLKLPKYKIFSNIDYTSVMKAFLFENGITNAKVISNKYATYLNSPDDKITYVHIDNVNGRLTFDFSEKPIPIKQIETGLLTETTAPAYFKKFIASYISADFQYTNVSVNQIGNKFTVTANRTVEGYPLYHYGITVFTDTMTFEDDGDLVMGTITVLDYDKTSAIEYEIIKPAEIAKDINVSSYGKALYEGGATFVSGKEYDWDNYNYYLPDGHPDKFPSISTCTVTDMEIVYFYTDTWDNSVYPMYRMNCYGEVEFKGGVYRVDAVIFGDAMKK